MIEVRFDAERNNSSLGMRTGGEDEVGCFRRRCRDRRVEVRPINRPTGPLKGSIGHVFNSRHSAIEVRFLRIFIFKAIVRLWDYLLYIPDVFNIQLELLFPKIT